MKNLRLGVKLIGGFSLTAIIILIVGIIAIIEQGKLQSALEVLENDALIAVESILTIQENSSEVVTNTRTLLSPHITKEQRRAAVEELGKHRKEIIKNQKIITSLPSFHAIEEDWKKYLSTLKSWVKANNSAVALSNELVANNIDDPEKLSKDMLTFEAAHRGLVAKISKYVFLGTPFEGGTDSNTCSLGRWLAKMPTDNQEIVAEMEKVRPIHTKLHKKVAEIKEMMKNHQYERAQLELRDHFLPLSEEVFAITHKVDEITKKYSENFRKMTEILLTESTKHQAENFAILAELVHKAESFAKETSEQANKAAAAGKTIIIICMVVGTILALLLGFLLTAMITRPLSKGVELAKSMADGDMTKTIDLDQKDEVGVLAKALNEMAAHLRSMLINIGDEVNQVNQSSTNLAAISSQMANGAEDTAGRSNQVSAAAEEMSANQNSVAAAMEEAAVNVNMVAAATEEMKSTITEISENSGKAKTITSQAVEKSQIASERVDELGRAANEINKVTETITEISEQTNLLALNATIEAARAGEAGKGFAVVANEIKALAQQTAEATLEIRDKINGIQQATGITVTEINDISNVISDVDQVVATIAAAVEEQSATT
ncbi:MAG: chemotaxis protein, partial [Desulfobacterales bacterium]